MEFAAALYDGASAARHEVWVRVSAEGLWLVERGELWRWAEVRVKEETALRVERGAAVLIVNSAEMAAVLRAVAPYARVDRVKGYAGAFLAAAVVGAALLVWLGYQFLLPWAGERMAAAAPREWEAKLGESAARSLLAGERVVERGEAVEAVDGVLARLQSALRGSPYSYRVSIVESETVNAGALPGGRIFVFSGLLKQCATADEFATVLAHEMMHVEKRHGMKNVGRQAAVSLLLAMLGSPDSLAAVMGAQMASLKYQRGDEEEADAEGLRLMARAGFDARAAARFFGKLASEEKGLRAPEYLSTHPDPEGRAARLAVLAKAMPLRPREVAGGKEWRAAVAGLR
jgi:predicted Zn-dependent protease